MVPAEAKEAIGHHCQAGASESREIGKVFKPLIQETAVALLQLLALAPRLLQEGCKRMPAAAGRDDLGHARLGLRTQAVLRVEGALVGPAATVRGRPLAAAGRSLPQQVRHVALHLARVPCGSDDMLPMAL